jgi:hypothetical protein
MGESPQHRVGSSKEPHPTREVEECAHGPRDTAAFFSQILCRF